MIGYDPNYDFLYDPQQAKPAGWCPCCGEEIYRPTQHMCDRCLKLFEKEDD